MIGGIQLAHEMGHARAAAGLGLRPVLKMDAAGQIACHADLPAGDVAAPRGYIAAAGPAAAIGWRAARAGEPLPTRLSIAQLRADATTSPADTADIDAAIAAGHAQSVAAGAALGLVVGREVAGWTVDDAELHLDVLSSGHPLTVA